MYVCMYVRTYESVSKINKKWEIVANQKRQMKNSKTWEISKILEILFRVFTFYNFEFCPLANIEK